jgi:GT2 family glycosyltransferase
MSTQWQIVHLDLSAGLTELPAGERGIFLVVWWHELPLGQLEINSEHLPMHVPELANRIAQAIASAVGDRLFDKGFRAPLPTTTRARPSTGEPIELRRLLSVQRPLSKLPKTVGDYLSPLSQSRTSGVSRPCPSISVVVCTRDRAESLQRCLHSLASLSPTADEIIVVDNVPGTDHAREVVRRYPRVRYVHEPRGGLDIARNTGVRQSTTEIVAFTDDDAEVHPAWITHMRAAFAEPNVMAVTGLVLPANLETEAQSLFETGWSFNRGYRARVFDRAWFERELPRGVPVDQIGAGANMAFRREIFQRIGGFDECLDVGAAGCSGDSEFWYRILAAGFACRYEPSAVVFHHHRRTMEDLRRQIFLYMRGHVAALLAQFDRHRHWGNVRRLLLTLPCHYIETLIGSWQRPEKRRTLWPQIAGHCSGIRFYLSERSRSEPLIH